MNSTESSAMHAAKSSALGYQYQSFYAFRTLFMIAANNAAVSVERLDELELKAVGKTLLYQLKHSTIVKPPTNELRV